MDRMFISLVLIFSMTAVTSSSDDFNTEVIDSVISETFDCNKHNKVGLSVIIVKHGKVIFSGGYGETDRDTKEPVTPDTLFGVASISKSFAATLLVKLLAQHNLSVDAKVSHVLKEKFVMPDELRTKETTFADLMAHRTAILSNNKLRFDNNLTRENLLERLRQLPTNRQFRVDYHYNNLIYGVVTYLAEVLGGDSWENLVREHLFSPIGMDRSTFATEADMSRSDIATGYKMDKKTGNFFNIPHEFSRRWALLAGSGSVLTSANDMAKWMNFHLYGGKNVDNDVQVMESENLKDVHREHFLIDRTASKDTNKPDFPVTARSNVYAHGLRKGFYRGYERLGHTGATWGYRAMMSMLPDEKVGVFTALTGDDQDYMFRVPLHMYLLDAALGLKPWLNVSTICSYPSPWKKTKKDKKSDYKTDLKLKKHFREYEGTYVHPGFGNIVIQYNRTLASLIMTYGWGQWRLFRQPSISNPTGKFYGKGQGYNIMDLTTIHFRSNQANRIADIRAVSFEVKSPPIFTKVSITDLKTLQEPMKCFGEVSNCMREFGRCFKSIPRCFDQDSGKNK